MKFSSLSYFIMAVSIICASLFPLLLSNFLLPFLFSFFLFMLLLFFRFLPPPPPPPPPPNPCPSLLQKGKAFSLFVRNPFRGTTPAPRPLSPLLPLQLSSFLFIFSSSLNVFLSIIIIFFNRVVLFLIFFSHLILVFLSYNVYSSLSTAF